MQRRNRHLPHYAAAITIAALALSSCTSSQDLYSWHKYEDIAYQHSKKQTEKTEQRFVKEIEKVINQQKGSRKVVPPGILAEYGFYLVKNGNAQNGVSFLRKEIVTYPESEAYITRIIKQIENKDEETD